jgi:prolipoprotein diacylglyceryltransferase
MVRPEWLGVPLYPTQILEAIGSALMAFYLYRLFQKSAGKPAGLVTAVYFASYGLLRCVMEYYRGDTVAFTSVMTIGQLLGLSLIGISGIVLFWRQRCSQPC